MPTIPFHSLGPAALALLIASLPSAAMADKTHRVRRGQTLSQIAGRYHVPVSTLAAANGMRRESPLRAGQTLRVPERGVVYVAKGQTLSAIAKDHDTTVAALMKLNRLRSATLRLGQRLVLPGYEAASNQTAAEKKWGRSKHPGTATFVRVQDRRKKRITLVDRRGRPRKAALRQLAHLMRAPKGRKRSGVSRPHPRLAQLLARVSDHFGGRPLLIVSGFRATGGYTSDTSRHTKGRAIDFRVQGVPNQVVHDYVSQFSDVGVGKYPKSTFVHLDVRDTDARWVDWSRPGQKPIYGKPGDPPPSHGAKERVDSDGHGTDEADDDNHSEPGPPDDTESANDDAA
ncbi:MAG: LysM peptidoglycan-binding domain-containing protein [Myxococcales bacterium]|nr:LysM peptidoglycan-binding domain-containing protein [Myxococcales bacterium]